VKIQIVKALKEFITVTGQDLMTQSLYQLIQSLAKEK